MRLATLALVTVLFASPARAELAATIAKVEKRVEVQKPGGPWIEARPAMELVEGDQVHTGFKSAAVLRFPDGSEVTVKPMTLLRVQRLDRAADTVSTSLQLRVGEIKASVGHTSGLASDFKVKTATCTASVRGTEIERIAYSPARGTEILMGASGAIEVSNRTGKVSLARRQATAVASSASLPPGDARTRARARALAPPARLTAAETRALAALGVPKAAPPNEGATGLVSSAVEVSTQGVADLAAQLALQEAVLGRDLDGDGVVSTVTGRVPPGTTVSVDLDGDGLVDGAVQLVSGAVGGATGAVGGAAGGVVVPVVGGGTGNNGNAFGIGNGVGPGNGVGLGKTK